MGLQAKARLVEREAELASLQAAAGDVAVRRRGRLVGIVGATGAGKSTLLDAAASLAADAHLRVLNARASELDSEFAFGVMLQLFERTVATATPGQQTALFAGAAALARPLFGEEPPSAPASDADARAQVHGLYRLAANAAWLAVAEGARGLAVLIDDLQHADAPSLRALGHIAQRLDDAPLLIVLTARGVSRAFCGAPCGELLHHRRAEILRPQALSPGAVTALARATLGPRADDAFCEACARVTGGNPFLIRELLNELQLSGVAPTGAFAEELADIAPETVQHWVVRRLRGLGADAERFARAAAILGGRCPPLLAGALAGLDEDQAIAAADALVAAEVLGDGDPAVFSHPLVRAAVEADMPPGQRALTHGRAAAVLADWGAAPERIAAHLLHAPAGMSGDTVEQLRRAAARAMARGAHESAARYLARALDEDPPDAVRAELLVDAAQAEMAGGGSDAVEWLGSALALIADPAARAPVFARLAEALIAQGEHERAASVLREAITELGDGDDAMCRELRAKYVTAAILVPTLAERGRRELERVLELSRGEGLPAERAVIAQLAVQHAMAAAPARDVAALAEQAWGGGALLEKEGLDGIAWSLVTGALTIAGRYAASMRVASAVIDEAERRGASLARATALFCRSGPRHRTGDLPGTIADVEAALAARSSGWAAYVGSATAVLALASIDSDELDRAEEVLGLLGDPHYAGGSSEAAPLLDARGWLHLARHDHPSALADFRAAGEAYEAFGMRVGFSFWRGGLALAAAALGERDDALSAIDADLGLAQSVGAPELVGRALRVKGVVIGGEPGRAMLERAVSLLAGSEARLEHVSALLDLGAAMRRSGLRAQARSPLHTAIGEADALGARALARRAREELRAAGGRLRAGPSDGRDVLTPGERRVAQLAAAGRTNREIAQQLFVTPKAVEWHLANAYRKLEIRSRRELAERLASPLSTGSTT